jgi:hypothetical protein
MLHAFFAFYRGCRNNAPLAGRYFVTTTYAALLFPGTFLWHAA